MTNHRYLGLSLLTCLIGATPLLATAAGSATFGGVMAAAGQCQTASSDGATNGCRGGLPLQIEGTLELAPETQLTAKLGYAVADGQNATSPWAVTPWAADLEADVNDINGRNRDNLLVARYRREQRLGAGTLAIDLGIIDATDYLDTNAYANDEFTQFLNGAFVNAPVLGLPSYDAGAAVNYHLESWEVAAVGMNVGENAAGRNFNFFGVQAGHTRRQADATGHYRLILTATTPEFPGPDGGRNRARWAGGLSLDQALNESLGVFGRLAWQGRNAAVTHDGHYSGGIHLTGQAWDRPTDQLGGAYAYLSGGNQAVDHTQVLEGFYRWGLDEHVRLTGAIQYRDADQRNRARRATDPSS